MTIKISSLLQGNTHLLSDLTPTLGGHLNTNGFEIQNGTSPILIGGVSGLHLPNGTTAQRPSSPSNGTIRYNTDANGLEVYQISSWISFTSIHNNLSGLQGGTSTVGLGSYFDIWPIGPAGQIAIGTWA